MTRLAKSRADGQPVPDVVEKIPAVRPGVSEVVNYDGATATTIAFGSDVTVLRIVCSTDAWYQIGSAPTATVGNNSHYIPANVIEYPAIVPGSDKISFIKATGAAAGFACVSQAGAPD